MVIETMCILGYIYLMRVFIVALLFYGCAAFNAQARPVSYPGGWTFMTMHDGDANSVHIHYSPTAKLSVGVRSEYQRAEDFYFNGVQLNNLVKRWNHKNSQANVYLKSGIGAAYSDAGELDGEVNAAGFTGIAADWEDRRYFVSYENRYIEAGDIHDGFHQKARLGVAPYIGDYGALHTWIMMEFEHDPESQETVSVTPLVRLFKGSHLMEAGVSNQGDVLFNYIKRF